MVLCVLVYSVRIFCTPYKFENFLKKNQHSYILRVTLVVKPQQSTGKVYVNVKKMGVMSFGNMIGI